MFEQGLEIPCRNRPPEQPSLADITAEPLEKRCGLGRLDTLGHRGETEAMAKTDHRSNDLPALSVAFHRAHEAGIDLELVERQGSKMSQARVARAKIVEREAHPQSLQLTKQRRRESKIADQRAFRDFEFETIRRKTGILEDAVDHGRQFRVAQLQRRYVAGQRDVGRPVGGGRACFPEKAVRHVSDQTQAFGQGDELGRRDHAASRVGPARQHLDPHDAAGVDRHQRLEVRHDLIGGNGLAQFAFEPGARAGDGVHADFEEAEAGPAVGFGLV